MHKKEASILFIFLCAGSASPQEFILQRISGAVHLDGLSDEVGWEAIKPLPLTMSSPVFEGEPTERTEIRITYDDTYFYASGRFYDSELEGIRGNSLSRDGSSPGDDHFGLILDTFNDNETALGFFTTPAGIRNDVAIYNDAESGGPPPWNSSWNTFWDVSVVTNSEGWFAEMRIPLSSLRFQDKDGVVVMGVKVFRYIARKNETVTYPPNPPKWDWGFVKPSIAQDVVLEGVYSRKPVYLTPYVLTGRSITNELNEDETEYIHDDDFGRELGFDVKYSLTSNITLDVTANTDFAQVEADDEQVNLTRFSLFFPEKRLFFLERSSVFDFRTGGRTRLFYSRRIGITEDGDPVRIYGGMRVIGRLGDWDVGVANMQTSKRDTIPGENFGVLRFRRRVLNENSYMGGMMTSRGGGVGYNRAYGLDALVRVFDDDYFSLIWAQSFDASLADEGRTSIGETGRFRVQWERRTNVGLGYEASMVWSAEHYKPGMGFITRENFKRYGDEISYGWYPDEKSVVYNHNVSLGGDVYTRNGDESVESASIGPEWNFGFKSGASGGVEIKMSYEDLTESFELSDDVEVPVGSYRFYTARARYDMPWGDLLRSGMGIEVGTFYDGSRVSFGLSPLWTISRYFQLDGGYEFNRMHFVKRDEVLSANILRMRIKATMNTEISTNAFIQYNNLSGSVSINFRLRYNPREGNDLYLVYSDLLNTDRYSSEPILPGIEARSVVMKYTYTFSL